jgi:peroxiredoxin
LGRLNQQFQAADTQVLVILGDSLERAGRYGTAVGVPFLILSDPTREVYHRYGLEKAYLVMQRTASAVVDRHGTIRYLQRVTNPMAWLRENQELLQTVQQLAQS